VDDLLGKLVDRIVGEGAPKSGTGTETDALAVAVIPFEPLIRPRVALCLGGRAMVQTDCPVCSLPLAEEAAVLFSGDVLVHARGWIEPRKPAAKATGSRGEQQQSARRQAALPAGR
jgi:hypothetical protein